MKSYALHRREDEKIIWSFENRLARDSWVHSMQMYAMADGQPADTIISISFSDAVKAAGGRKNLEEKAMSYEHPFRKGAVE